MPEIKISDANSPFYIHWAEIQRIRENEKINVLSDGVQTHNKFVHMRYESERQLNWDYTDGRIWDALARMFVALKPCCAVYPEFTKDNPKKLEKLVVAFNRDINESGQGVIHSICGVISLVRKGYLSGDHLLSMVVNMQEYQIINRLQNLTKYFICLMQEARGPEKLLDCSLVSRLELKELFLKLEKYTSSALQKRRDFNKNADKFFEQEVSLQNSIDKVLRTIKSAEYLSANGVSTGNFGEELGYSMMKLNIIIGDLIKYVTPAGQSKVCKVFGIVDQSNPFQKQYEEFSDAFSRAMQDVQKVVRYLPLGFESITPEFVTNLDNIHAELSILNHKILELIQGSSYGYVESVKLLEHSLGVSKLSCEECYIVFEILGLNEYVRGGHGQLFHGAPWHLPKWVFKVGVFAQIVSEKLEEYLKDPNGKEYHRPDDIHPCEHGAGFSDDESDEPTQLSKEGYLGTEDFALRWFDMIFGTTFEMRSLGVLQTDTDAMEDTSRGSSGMDRSPPEDASFF